MPTRPPFVLLPWLTLLLLSPSLARAEQPALLPDTQVTGSPIEQLAPTTTRTDAKTLDKRFIRSFEDLGRRAEPGVTFNRGNQSINIRGLDGDRVQTTLDGIRVPYLRDNIRSVSGGLDAIDFNSLSSVDIVRGANSSQKGSGALAGSLQLRTLNPADLLGQSDRFAGLGKSDYDSADDSWGLNGALAARMNDTSWLLHVGHRQGHELDNQGKADVVGALRSAANPAQTEQNNLLFKLQQQLGEHRLGLTGEYFKGNKDIDALTGRLSAYPNHYDTAEHNERQRVSIEHHYQATTADGLIDWADNIVYWQKSYREDEVRATRATVPVGPFGRNNEIEKNQFGVNSSLGKQLGHHDLTLGGEISRVTTQQYSAGYDGCPTPLRPVPATPMPIFRACSNLHTNAPNMPKTPGMNYALSIKDDISLTDKLTLTPGLRYDRYAYTAKSTSGFAQNSNNALIKDNKDSQWSASMLLTWQAHAQATLYAQWAQGFRAPDPDELYSTLTNFASRYVRIGNANLKPEKSTGYEVGARLGNDALGGSLSLFDNEYKNFIDEFNGNAADFGFSPAQVSFVFATGNRDHVRIYGAESKAHWQFAPDWKAWGSAAWAVGKDRQSNNHLNSVAPLTGSLGLSYERSQYGADLIFTAAQARSKVELDTDFKAPGYGIVDLTAYWQPAGLNGVKLQAGVFNLLDKTYWNAINGPQTVGRTTAQPNDYYTEPGRSLRVSAAWQF